MPTVKCPAKGCEMRLEESDTRAQVLHMTLMEGDAAHDAVVKNRLRGLKAGPQ